MSSVTDEILALEEQLRLAELGPDATFFQKHLAAEMIIVTAEGTFPAKEKVVAAHQPGKAPKFLRVEMNDMTVIEHGSTAVVTCAGTFETAQSKMTLKFMRVWVKKNGAWQIVAGTVMN